MNERTQAYLDDRGARPRITRRWAPRLDVYVKLGQRERPERHPGKPWRVDLPTDNAGGVTEYTATQAEALAIALWWAQPAKVIVNLDLDPTAANAALAIPGRLWLIPSVTNTEQEQDHDHDL